MKQDEQRQELFSVIQITESASQSKRPAKPGMLIKRWLDIPSFGLSVFKRRSIWVDYRFSSGSHFLSTTGEIGRLGRYNRAT